MLLGAVLFVLGFTAIFVATGALFGTLGSSIAVHHLALERIFGVVTVVMGLVFLGRFSFLQRERKVHRLPQIGLFGAPLLGLTFGLAWTPCLTPTFGAVYGAGRDPGDRRRGARSCRLSTVWDWVFRSCWWRWVWAGSAGRCGWSGGTPGWSARSAAAS